MADQYVSGDWKVRTGSEDEFVARWRAFTGWSLENAPGARSFVLIRDMDEPRHFLSFGSWTDLESVRAWRATSEFAQLLGRCRELCEEFHAGDYSLAASPTRAPVTSNQGTATDGV
jgi:heme-degrading monooxygenase HmoA